MSSRTGAAPRSTWMAPASEARPPSELGVRPPKGRPEPELRSPSTFAGEKKSAMPRRCSSEVAFSSHISRKKAIMAVTKSA
jgi:hypothetical protein